MLTIITYMLAGQVLTEKVGEFPVGDECRACNPDCKGSQEDCEQCVKEAMDAEVEA